MFGTLHWNSDNKDAKFVERLHESSASKKYSACDRCRAKKVTSCEPAIIDGLEIRTFILTDLLYTCRSNAVPPMTIAAAASALGRRALSVPRSIEAISDYGKQAVTLHIPSARWTSQPSHRLLRAPKTPGMRKGCPRTSGPLPLHP